LPDSFVFPGPFLTFGGKRFPFSILRGEKFIKGVFWAGFFLEGLRANPGGTQFFLEGPKELGGFLPKKLRGKIEA